MLDTVKVGIPLTQSQYKRVHDAAFSNTRPQWVLFLPDTGELRFRRVVGLASMDQNSFHREIRWDIPSTYHKGEAYMTIELSLPKLYYGHNICLLYDFVKALELLKSQIERQFEFKGRGKLTSIYEWQLWRVDCCYAWDCRSEKIAQQVLDSLKHLSFPRKEPVIYSDGILFKGTTYSLKFYLKYPEFRQHDLKELIKQKASLEWINHCEDIAKGVLRVEATLRRKYLKQRNIKTVADLLEPEISYDFDLDSHPEGFDFNSAVFAIHCYHMDISEDSDWSVIAANAQDGQSFNAPEGYELEYFTQKGKAYYRHTGAGFILRKVDQPTAILQFLLTKFLGQNPVMQHTDEVKIKLEEAFKPVKAARLMSMWLYVQRFGVARAKEDFGRDSYYAARRDMKKAGVSLMEPSENVIRMDDSFIRDFRMSVPSPHVKNKFDNFRDGGHVLNLPSVATDG